MLIKVVFDKSALDGRLKSGWGFSVLVDNRVLFDTGENGEWLLENLRFLGADINKIEAVVISHDHWDHWGGLWDLLRQKKGVPVYICPNFSPEFKERAVKACANCIEAEDVTEIIQNVFSTGEVAGSYHGKYMAEQALVLKTAKGISVFTGCAHPGIIKIIRQVRNRFPEEAIYLVAGGFHLKESDRHAIEIIAEDFKKMNILKSGPAHCSGEIAEGIFRKAYNENFIQVKTGLEIGV